MSSSPLLSCYSFLMHCDVILGLHGWQSAKLYVVSPLLTIWIYHSFALSHCHNEAWTNMVAGVGRGVCVCSKNTFELLNLRALKFSPLNKIYIFQCMGKIFVWNFKGTLWNSTQNILPIYWKIWFLYNSEILRAHTRFWTPHVCTCIYFYCILLQFIPSCPSNSKT